MMAKEITNSTVPYGRDDHERQADRCYSGWTVGRCFQDLCSWAFYDRRTKISKSLGNAIDPRELIPQYGFDAIRYFLLREIPCGEDGDFSRERLKDRYHADLGNTFGNLVNRVVAMSKKYFEGKVPSVDPMECRSAEMGTWNGLAGLEDIRKQVERRYHAVRCDEVLEAIWNGVGEGQRSGLLQANKYIEETQPFKLVKTDPAAVARILYALLEACRWYAWLVHPVMPVISRQIFEQLGLNVDEELRKGWDAALVWGGLKPGTPRGTEALIYFRRMSILRSYDDR